MSSANRSGDRLERDQYQTPLWAINAVLPYFQWSKISTVLEPCKGDGHIWNSLPPKVKRTWREIAQGRDYLRWTPKNEFDLILTNPPFSLGMEFLQKSLTEAQTVAYLFRVNFLGSIERAEFWEKNLPDHMLVLYPRPSFVFGGTDSTEYAWFIWDRGALVKPGTRPIEVISHPDAPCKKIPLPSETFEPASMYADAVPAEPKKRVRGK